MSRDYRSTRQAASALGVSQRVVQSRLRRGELEGRKVNGRWQIDHEALYELCRAPRLTARFYDPTSPCIAESVDGFDLITVTPDGSPAPPMQLLTALMRGGLFVAWTPDPQERHDCHETTDRIFADLWRLKAPGGWTHVQGRLCAVPGLTILHSWLECVGWALDFANGRGLCMPVDTYYRAGFIVVESRVAMADFTAENAAHILRHVPQDGPSRESGQTKSSERKGQR